MDAPRMIIFAVDGCDYLHMTQLLAGGELPNMRRLAGDGAFGPLESTTPPVTSMAWPSIFTGVNPGKHGIFNFFDFPRGNRAPRPVFMDECKAPTLWAMLNQAGYTVGVWRLPWGYPAEQVDGYMLCDKSPDAPTGVGWPDGLVSEIEAAVGGFVPWSGEKLRAHTSPKPLLQAFSEELEAEEDLLEECMTRWPADVVLCGMSLLDLMAHQMLGCGADARQAMTEGYRQIDQWIGGILERWAGPDTTVAVVSDHGLGPMPTNANVLRVLVDDGHLELETIPFGQALPAARLAAKAYLSVRGSRSGGNGHDIDDDPAANASRFSSRVDWEKSSIVPWGMPGALWLTKQAGDSSAVERFREAVTRLTDRRSRTRLIETVRTKEELYWGPHLDGAPDLVVVPGDGVALVTGTGVVPGGHDNVERQDEVLWNTRPLLAPRVYDGRSWFHRPQGVYMLSGPNLSSGANIREASVIDVTPTLLYALGLPIATNMDGRVHTEAFCREELASRPLRFHDNLAVSEFTEPISHGDQAESGITKRLQGMGYL